MVQVGKRAKKTVEFLSKHGIMVISQLDCVNCSEQSDFEECKYFRYVYGLPACMRKAKVR